MTGNTWPRGALVALLHEVLQPELRRVHADRPRELVGVLLDGPAHLRGGRGAHRSGWLQVGVGQVCAQVDVGNPVGAVGVHDRHLGEERRIGGVGAVVQHQAGAAGHERAVALHAALQLDHHALAAVVGGDELLAAREHQLARPARGARQGGDVGLVVELALAAEAAAQVRDDDAHLVLGQAERVGDAGAGAERHLRGRPDGDLRSLPLRDHRMRLDRHGVRHVGHVAALDDGVGRRHRGVGVALGDGRVGRVVAVAHHGVVGRVPGPVLVHQLGALRERALHIDDGRLRLVGDLDHRRGLLGELGRERGHRGDDLALEAHGVGREQPLILDEGAVRDVRDVLVGDHRKHAGERPGGARVHREDARAGVVGEPELGVEHAREGHVRRVAARSRDLLPAVLADVPRTDDRRHWFLLLDRESGESNQRRGAKFRRRSACICGT